MSNFWKQFGKIFASVAKGAATVALWASQHPEVVSIIASAVKLPPGVVSGLEVGTQVVGAIEQGQQK